MKPLSLFAAVLFLIVCGSVAGTPLYQQDFESSKAGSVPEDFLVIDGQFAVREVDGGKVFELPGAPLDTFGFVFGPKAEFNDAGDRFKVGSAPGNSKELAGVVVSARAFGTRQGRRYPTYSVGLCGVSGYKLRVAPMKRAIELVQADETVASASHDFASGAWMRLKLQVRSSGGKWIAEAKVWKDGDVEPEGWQLTASSTERPNPGKASCWAAPFSGQPIRFDDLVVEGIEK